MLADVAKAALPQHSLTDAAMPVLSQHQLTETCILQLCISGTAPKSKSRSFACKPRPCNTAPKHNSDELVSQLLPQQTQCRPLGLSRPLGLFPSLPVSLGTLRKTISVAPVKGAEPTLAQAPLLADIAKASLPQHSLADAAVTALSQHLLADAAHACQPQHKENTQPSTASGRTAEAPLKALKTPKTAESKSSKFAERQRSITTLFDKLRSSHRSGCLDSCHTQARPPTEVYKAPHGSSFECAESVSKSVCVRSSRQSFPQASQHRAKVTEPPRLLTSSQRS